MSMVELAKSIERLLAAGSRPDGVWVHLPARLCGSSVAKMRVRTIARKCGLVASAFGMLHCRGAVERLEQQWCAAPWANRLRPFYDYCQILFLDTIPSTTSSGDAASAHQPLFGRWGPGVAEGVDKVIPVGLGWDRTVAALRGVRRAARGGGRAAVLIPQSAEPLSLEGWDRWNFDNMLRLCTAERARNTAAPELAEYGLVMEPDGSISGSPAETQPMHVAVKDWLQGAGPVLEPFSAPQARGDTALLAACASVRLS
jgi:hypothetical protein